MKLIAILALFVAAPLPGAPIFRNSLPIQLPVRAAEALRGDFNGDGHPDVLAPAGLERKYAVYLANGTGPFAAAVVTDVSIEPYAIALGDLNGDGRTDVVAADWYGTLLPALANADGSLTLGTTHTTGTSGVDGLAVGDFNGDQHVDVATSADSTLTVSFGNGAGQFSGSATQTFPSGVGRPVPGDFNRDGKLDLLAAHMLLNAGNGTFTRTTLFVGGPHLIRDFNHDGKLDVATIWSNWTEQYVAVRLGDGNGTFGAASQYASGYGPEAFDAADVDADGNLDLLISAMECRGIGVLRGKADGTFHPMELLVAGVVRGVVAGDFDRDQKIDLAGIEFAQEPTALAFIRGNGNGTFDGYRGFHTNPTAPVGSFDLSTGQGAVADMNGDGRPDVVLPQVTSANPRYPRIAVLLNDGTGALAEPLTTDTAVTGSTNAPLLATGDVDNDGRQDVVLLPENNLPFTLRGLGNGQFAAPVTFSTSLRGKPFLGHFNADSSLDLFVPSGHTSMVYPGNGDGTFGAGITGLQAHNPLTGDLNGDGRLDYISSSLTGWVLAAINDGTGHFTSIDVTREDVNAVALADFNGDTKLDLLLQSSSGRMQTRFGNGDGTFAAPVGFMITPSPGGSLGLTSVTTADFDGDGKRDVSFGTSVYLSNGDGTFRSRSRHRADFEAIAATDMDGNGTPDLVGVNRSGDDVAILPTRTTADPTRPSTLTLSDDQGGALQYARPVTFSAAVQGNGVVALTGVVRFTIDGVDVALAAVNALGIATYSTSFELGAHEITATYSGDEHYLTSADTANVTVGKAASQLTIQGFPNPAPKGQRVSVYVHRSAPGFPGPTGALTLRDGDTPLDAPIVDGVAQVRNLTIGTHVISVDYAGDDHYLPATASYTQEITKPVPPLRLQLPPAPVLAGEPATIRAYFAAGTSPLPTGTITFYDFDTVIGSAPIVDGAVTIQPSFEWGYHLIDAEYSGDATWASTRINNWPLPVLLGHWGTVPIIQAWGTSSSLYLRWSQIVGATSYKIWRKTTASSPWELEATFDTNQFGSARSIPAGTSRLYAVTAIDADGNVSPMSAPDLATGISFTDPVLTPGATPVRAVHTTQLRSAVDAVRTFAGLPPFGYTYGAQVGAPVRALDLTQLRTALSQALGAIGMPAMQFTDAAPSTIRAAHFLEIRSVVN